MNNHCFTALFFGRTLIFINHNHNHRQTAWSQAADETFRLFWTYRLEFLTENRIFATVGRRTLLGKLEGLIDNVEDVKLSDGTPWTKAPYNMVDTKEKYDNPFDYFPEDIAQQIEDTHSLQATLYWVKTESINAKKKVGGAGLYFIRIKVLAKFFVQFLVYSMLVILGLFTCGWFWPRNLRRTVLSIGLQEAQQKAQAKDGEEEKEA